MSAETPIEAEPTPSGWRALIATEDAWAVWVASALILAGAAIFLPRPPEGLDARIAEANQELVAENETAPFRTLAWHTANDAKSRALGSKHATAKQLSGWLPKVQKWSNQPLDAFVLGEAAAKGKREAALAGLAELELRSENLAQRAAEAEANARTADFQDEQLNEVADERIRELRENVAKQAATTKKTKAKPYNLFGRLAAFGVLVALLLAIGMKCMGHTVAPFLRAFDFVYVLAIVAYFIASQADIKAAGFGYAGWAILIGLLISNTIGTPNWAKPAVQTEYYIKTGLVLLGVEILFGKILVIGLPGIFVAWVVTPIVFLLTYLFGQRVLKIGSKSLNLTLSADMSVCGVSAAIATAAACRAKKEELTLAVGISLVFTSIMMIALPNLILFLGMDPVLGGAWIGGTVDATGAVAAAGAFLGDEALYVAATIKMIQNILIGVIAFCVAVYWVSKVEKSKTGDKPSAWEIWRRFPKFVLGFLAASIVSSLVYESLGADVGETLISNGVIKSWTKTFRGWFFCLAFVSIGLATDFRSLRSYLSGGKPVLLYICGQALNLALTLGVAYLMFYVVFRDIGESL